MAKVKKKLTPARKRAKAEKAEREGKFERVFINGKQVRVKRPPTVDGIPVGQFIEENADPLWLHQNELWEVRPVEDAFCTSEPSMESESTVDSDGIPF